MCVLYARCRFNITTELVKTVLCSVQGITIKTKLTLKENTQCHGLVCKVLSTSVVLSASKFPTPWNANKTTCQHTIVTLMTCLPVLLCLAYIVCKYIFQDFPYVPCAVLQSALNWQKTRYYNYPHSVVSVCTYHDQTISKSTLDIKFSWQNPNSLNQTSGLIWTKALLRSYRNSPSQILGQQRSKVLHALCLGRSNEAIDYVWLVSNQLYRKFLLLICTSDFMNCVLFVILTVHLVSSIYLYDICFLLPAVVSVNLLLITTYYVYIPLITRLWSPQRHNGVRIG